VRFIDRSKVPPPASLTAPSAAVATERDNVGAHYGYPPALAAGVTPPRVRPLYNKFSQYKNWDVGQQLTVLFDGKCAYCESMVGAPNSEEIEHYRPKGGITGEPDHNGYWWLASDWNNLLLSCTGCNQGRKQHLVTPDMDEKAYLELISVPPKRVVGKRNQFPIGGVRACHPGDDLKAEIAHLIDPTERDPRPSLRWAVATDLSVVVPQQVAGGDDPFGAATIAICALNRSKLVKERTGLLQQLRVYRKKIFEQLDADDSPAGVAQAMVIVDLLRDFAAPGKIYTAMVEAFVADVADEFDARLARQRAERARHGDAGPPPGRRPGPPPVDGNRPHV